ncbi:uncharacterized protein EKO05_0005444 [Ascochyta rabiei]|uniref:Uncharacterized protein n=1 Tax=Didymella rabiei TaxID=5454 RepID=A0A163JR67_DIDRA|nr:uncharacterized protein EKO05_0005444 [Ascochyta rabiei]KZM26530.1 hypothetical protein ST47_g2300 [Ascochyta rabiei]UPX14976.1 hypothetical protein EKO05_0005444 [Ascochyta rabiei]
MDNNDIFFGDLPPTLTTHQPPRYTKPTDDFRPLPSSDTSVLYLAITTPHTDTYTIHGPVRSFSHLLPPIQDRTSSSPSAIDKLDALAYTPADAWGEQTPSAAFETHGFRTFIVEGQRATFTVLEVLREDNPLVREALPAPVYTVTRHGPLVYSFSGVGAGVRVGEARGFAATSALVGSFVERGAARTAARDAMERLVAGEGVVSRIEEWGAGDGGVLLAMGRETRWEVRVLYEDETLQRAKEVADAEGAGVGWRY